MNLKRLKRKMAILVYNAGGFSPNQRVKSIEILEAAWNAVEAEG